MKKFTFFWILSLLISSFAFSQNLVVNPSFENWTDNQPDNWLADGGAITVSQNTEIVQDGTSSCHVVFTSTENQYLTSDAFAVEAGSPFILSVYFHDNDPAGKARLCCLWDGADNYYGDYSDDMEGWQMISYEGVVPDGVTSAQFQIRFYDVSANWDEDAEILVDMASLVLDNEIKPEPSNYPTDFTAANSGVNANISWTDAVGDQLPQKYLVMASATDDFTAPVDGSTVDDDSDLSDGSAALNVSYGEQLTTFTGLSPASTYYFTIFPYTNSGSDTDYKTDATAPATSLTTPDVSILSSVDFEDDTFGGWEAVNVSGDEVWGISTYGNPGNCAYMSGYNEQPNANEDWFISPTFNFDDYSQETLIFDNATKFDGPAMQLFISSNYEGDPSTATWTELDFAISSGDWQYVSSGEVDLDLYTGMVNLGFKYESSSSESAAWEIDNILLTGSMSNSVSDLSKMDVSLYPNPGYGIYRLNNPKNENLTINVYNIMGQNIYTIDDSQAEISIDLTNEDNGVYIVQILGEKTTASLSVVKK